VVHHDSVRFVLQSEAGAEEPEAQLGVLTTRGGERFVKATDPHQGTASEHAVRGDQVSGSASVHVRIEKPQLSGVTTHKAATVIGDTTTHAGHVRRSRTHVAMQLGQPFWKHPHIVIRESDELGMGVLGADVAGRGGPDGLIVAYNLDIEARIARQLPRERVRRAIIHEDDTAAGTGLP